MSGCEKQQGRNKKKRVKLSLRQTFQNEIMSWTARGESEKSVNKFSQAEVQTHTLHTHTHPPPQRESRRGKVGKSEIALLCAVECLPTNTHGTCTHALVQFPQDIHRTSPHFAILTFDIIKFFP